jgi:hypothetical protein
MNVFALPMFQRFPMWAPGVPARSIYELGGDVAYTLAELASEVDKQSGWGSNRLVVLIFASGNI